VRSPLVVSLGILNDVAEVAAARLGESSKIKESGK